jgi:hypothetical protein
MKIYIYALTLFITLFTVTSKASQETLFITHYQGHERYEYGAKLLDLALSKLNIPYQINVSDENITNEARGELEVISGNLDLQWMSTSLSRETSMIPVKIPIYQGALGLRLLLINQDNEPEFNFLVRNLTDLQRYTGGHGLHWGDLPVYKANGLKVLPHKDYSSIFELLKLNRIDYFHRGINEIWAEHARHNDSLSIAQNTMLFYPLPVYFFVSKQKPELASHLEKGLNIAIEDGSFRQLFEDYMGDYIRQGELEQRKNLIILNNPTLPLNPPKMNFRWWLPENYANQISSAIY